MSHEPPIERFDNPDERPFDKEKSDVENPDAGRSGGGPPSDARRQRIHAELIRVRQEASLARLEAKAAVLQSTLDRIDAGDHVSDDELAALGIDQAIVPPSATAAVMPPAAAPGSPAATTPASPAATTPGSPAATTPRSVSFASWDAVRSARTSTTKVAVEASSAEASSAEALSAEALSAEASSAAEEVVPRSIRQDSPHAAVRAPRMLAKVDHPATPKLDPSRPNPSPPNPSPPNPSPPNRSPPNPNPAVLGLSSETVDAEKTDAEKTDAEQVEAPEESLDPEPSIAPWSLDSANLTLKPDDPDAPPTQRKRSPAAIIVSTFVHVGVVLFLAMVSLSTRVPKDQVALSASVSASEESSMETFSIETSQPAAEAAASAPSETVYDISPVGEMVAVEMTSDSIGEMTELTESLASLSGGSSSALKSLASASTGKATKMEFCGVEGGGNHFVYLVDSSGSMGDAFNSARNALLQSIDMLTDKQRFYVVFFDAQSDYMQLSTPGTDEPRSVEATDENKRKLRSWAMRIGMDKGRAPYDALKFALGLKPDVIFLLSDGEFPQGIEDLLSEQNKVTNLFGETNPISIVHTISYFSQEGESRMRRIAEQNAGQYRYIPDPSR